MLPSMTLVDMENRIENDIVLNESSVWVLVNKKEFSYSDGSESERYLQRAFSRSTDLSSTSDELEQWIRDWPSEYHLTRKRAQLLRGFDFEKSNKVLEVGCGCGAITRFLGETFDDVIAIEGSESRARLASLRTQDMKNVSILSAPFQDIKFKKKFDIIFCIGVFEYSNRFIDDLDTHNKILQYFSDILVEDGIIFIAIENQFGLKYFSLSREDHTNIMFEGLEGYPRYGNRARTFGYDELKSMLSKYFPKIDFYFPYPDYKIPSCVLSEKFFSKVKAGELVGKFQSRDYCRYSQPLFEEKLVLLELDKNNKLPFFSNSFLVTAGKKETRLPTFRHLGLMYSDNRVEQFRSETRFIDNGDGVRVEKRPLYHRTEVKTGSLTLQASQSGWLDGLSLQSQILKRSKEKDVSLDDLFGPCKIWLEKLKSISSQEGDRLMLGGRYFDCIWENSYIQGGECTFIDHEWKRDESIGLNVIVIRSIFHFISDTLFTTDLTPILRIQSKKKLIVQIAACIGTVLNERDFKEFSSFESEMSHIVYGSKVVSAKMYISLLLWNGKTCLYLLRRYRNLIHQKQKVVRVLSRMFGRSRNWFE